MNNYRPTRPQHRARSHDDAHTAEEAHDPADLQANPLVHRGEAKLVTTQEGLVQLIERLRAAGSFAYDSEFIGELTYLPKLCLIQVATTQEISLIDPMARGIDITPFWELVADASVEKITHAGQQDLEPVIRHLDRPGQNVFDTQISAGFVGMAYPVSLSKLVKEITGARLGKGLTFTHWDQRPLSNQQLKYAANDVRYLPAIRAELGRRLENSATSRGRRRSAMHSATSASTASTPTPPTCACAARVIATTGTRRPEAARDLARRRRQAARRARRARF
jgi:ribonuclease D